MLPVSLKLFSLLSALFLLQANEGQCEAINVTELEEHNITELKENSNGLSDQVKDVNTNLTNQVDELNNVVTELEEHNITELKENINGLSDQVKDLNTNLTNQVDELNNDVTELEQQNTELEGNITRLSDQVKDLNTNLINQVDVNNELKNDVSFLTKTLLGQGIMIQQRVDGSVDFYRNWDEYVEGFGNPNTNIWLGLETIHKLSKGGVKLRVDLWFTGRGFKYPNDINDIGNNDYGKNYNNEHKYAEYNNFSIGSAATNYNLNVSGYHGTAGDSLEYSNGFPFTTKDRDNDKKDSVNCAVERTAAWWYNSCAWSNLNGEYGGNHNKGTRWHFFTGFNPASRVEMKIWI